MKAIEVSLAAICTLLLVNVTQSAPEPRRERRPEPPPERREPPPEIFERILDEDQRAELRETFRENRERLREIEEQVRAGRRELHEAMLKGEVDEPEMKKKIDEIAKLEGERQFIRFKALAKIRPSLSDEQVERLKELHGRRQGMARDLPPGPGRPRDFRPDREARERYREQIAPRPPGEPGFDERRPREPQREQRFEREGERRFDESRPRFQDEPPPRGPAPRRQLDQRRPPPRDFPDNGDVPLPPPSRGRPDPE